MANSFVVPTPQGLAEFVGRELAVSDSLEVTQQRIQQFAEATGDRQWIHTDAERAGKESPYGSTIAHGFLTLSLISQMMEQAVRVRGVRLAVNYGLNRVRFPGPVRAGSQIRGRFHLHSVKEVGGAVEAVYGVTVEIEGEQKPCCVAEWIVRYYF
ncbi:MAG TPA: MaoC family dehydratase [Terriglobales bacterium]|jgi:acyl dehydratase|nr:MaoC family dehydratase [Terriglobales bacterium]